MKIEYPFIFPHHTWDTLTDPEEVGWSSRLLAVAQAYTQAISSAAVMVVYQGRQLCAWGVLWRNWALTTWPPRLSGQEKQATLRDLLQSRSGVYHEASYETEWAKASRPARGSHAPGTFWYYNNWTSTC